MFVVNFVYVQYIYGQLNRITAIYIYIMSRPRKLALFTLPRDK